jgi:hypothetical protein
LVYQASTHLDFGLRLVKRLVYPTPAQRSTGLVLARMKIQLSLSPTEQIGCRQERESQAQSLLVKIYSYRIGQGKLGFKHTENYKKPKKYIRLGKSSLRN